MMARWAAWIVAAYAACGHGGAQPVGPGSGSATGAMIDAAPPKVLQINQPGQEVDLNAFTVAGHVTIVDFWATWCGSCKVMEDKFMAKIGDDPRVVIRKVDVGDGDTPVAKAYQVRALPVIWIYDAKKQLRYVLAANDCLLAGDHALELARASGSAN